MIDPQVYLTGITLLSKHFNRELQPEVIRIWKDYLSSALSTEQFQQAVRTVLLESRFFPTAKELVESIKGDSEGQALVAWERCLKAAARNDRTLLGDLSPQANFALTTVGGLSRLGQSEEEKHSWLRKEFLAAWKSWIPSLSKALPPADDTFGAKDPVIDQAAVEHMRSLIEKVSLTRQNLKPQITPIVKGDVSTADGNISPTALMG